jgi:hypothetical protein
VVTIMAGTKRVFLNLISQSFTYIREITGLRRSGF